MTMLGSKRPEIGKYGCISRESGRRVALIHRQLQEAYGLRRLIVGLTRHRAGRGSSGAGKISRSKKGIIPRARMT